MASFGSESDKPPTRDQAFCTMTDRSSRINTGLQPVPSLAVRNCSKSFSQQRKAVETASVLLGFAPG
jgi:hypothetical protein